MPESTVFAVASAKGGVGKTTTSINIGTALTAFDLDVVVAELDLAMANVVDFLSLDFDDESDASMHDVLAGEVPVTEALYDAPGGAAVVPSGTSLDALGSIDVTRLSEVVETLSARFDVVIIDTGAGVNTATTTALQVADETILVSTPRVASIRDTEKTRTIATQRGAEVSGLVLTQAGTGSSPDSRRLSEFLGVDLLCTVPHDPSIHESQDDGVPVVERRPDSEAAEAYVAGATALMESRNAATTDAPVTDESETDERAARTESKADLPVQELADEQTAERPGHGGDDAKPSTPSKATLEAQGWTFPGEDGDEVTRSGDAESDGVAHGTRDQDLRSLTADGGEASLPDEACGPGSPQSVDLPSPPDEPLAEPRASGDADEGEQTDGEVTGDDDGTADDRSLAGRLSAFLRRSE